MMTASISQHAVHYRTAFLCLKHREDLRNRIMKSITIAYMLPISWSLEAPLRELKLPFDSHRRINPTGCGFLSDTRSGTVQRKSRPVM